MDLDSSPETFIEFFPIAIGEYESADLENLPVGDAVDRVLELLRPFRPRAVPWPVPMDARGHDAVNSRIGEWARAGSADSFPNSILYWVGHGWSDGELGSLANHKSPKMVGHKGLTHAHLASAITERERAPGNLDSWAIVVLEACKSRRIAELVGATLGIDQYGARRVLLIGTSGDGATTLHRFADALDGCLNVDYPTEETIKIRDLTDALEARMEHGYVEAKSGIKHLELIRLDPPASTPVALDALAELRQVIRSLSNDDERQHFVPKAQGAELGDSLWFFEGRDAERASVVNWLAETNSGMLVITGNPGSGKSALIGNLIAYSRPALRRALVDLGYLPELAPTERPQDNAFQTAVLLTGATVESTVVRLANDLALGEPPSGDTSVRIDWLLRTVSRGFNELTLIFDGLDEAQEPIAIAQSLILRLASLDGVRVVLATRQSSDEDPDTGDSGSGDIFSALGRTPDSADVVVVERDTEAIKRYVERRLTSAIASGLVNEGQVPIADIGASIASRGGEFLYARLAVHELIYQPELMETSSAGAIDELLDGNHRTLFASAVDRLSNHAAPYRGILIALAAALGRGVPSRDGIWLALASALVESEVSQPDIDRFIADAAPYITLDKESGQSVYRFAHRTFHDYFGGHGGGVLGVDQDAHKAIVMKLIEVSAERSQINPYVQKYLTGHISRSERDMWWALSRRRSLLDRIDHESIAADGFRSLFGRALMPPEIAGVIGNRHLIRVARDVDRRGLREVGMARFAGVENPKPAENDTLSAWSLEWAHVDPGPTHVTLSGHDGPVEAVLAISDDSLVSGGVDGTVRLWDAATGTEVRRFIGRGLPVRALAVIDEDTLVSAGDDRELVVWSFATGGEIARFPVAATEARGIVTLSRGLAALASSDGTVSLVDLVAGSSTTLGGTRGVVTCIALAGNRLIGGGVDGSLYVWNTDHLSLVGSYSGGSAPIRAVAMLSDSAVVTGAADGAIDVWEIDSGARRQLGRVGKDVSAVAVTHEGNVVAADPAGLISVLDSASGEVLNRLRGHVRGVLCLGITRTGQIMSGGVDRTIRIWDTASSTHDAGTAESFSTASVAIDRASSRVLSLGSSGVLRVWDLVTGSKMGEMKAHTGAGRALSIGQHGSPVLTGGSDRLIRLWFPDGASLVGHTAGVTSLRVAASGLVFSCSEDGVLRVWDLVNRSHVARLGAGEVFNEIEILGDGRVACAANDGTILLWDHHTDGRERLNGHRGAVSALSTLGGRLVSGGEDGTIRIWNLSRDDHDALSGHSAGIRAVVTVDDGRVIAGYEDGWLSIWQREQFSWKNAAFPVGIDIRCLAASSDIVAVGGSEGLLLIRLR